MDLFYYLNMFFYKYIDFHFFFSFFILIFIFFFFYLLILQGNIEYKNYVFDFSLRNFSDINLPVKSNFLNDLWYFFFIKLVDLSLDFIDYFFFFLTTYFFYPELFFWHAFIINKFNVQNYSVNRINYDIFNVEFNYEAKLRFIFLRLKQRWILNYRYFFTIYALYIKIIIRLFFFFFIIYFYYFVFF